MRLLLNVLDDMLYRSIKICTIGIPQSQLDIIDHYLNGCITPDNCQIDDIVYTAAFGCYAVEFDEDLNNNSYSEATLYIDGKEVCSISGYDKFDGYWTID